MLPNALQIGNFDYYLCDIPEVASNLNLAYLCWRGAGSTATPVPLVLKWGQSGLLSSINVGESRYDILVTYRGLEAGRKKITFQYLLDLNNLPSWESLSKNLTLQKNPVLKLWNDRYYELQGGSLTTQLALVSFDFPATKFPISIHKYGIIQENGDILDAGTIAVNQYLLGVEKRISGFETTLNFVDHSTLERQMLVTSSGFNTTTGEVLVSSLDKVSYLFNAERALGLTSKLVAISLTDEQGREIFRARLPEAVRREVLLPNGDIITFEVLALDHLDPEISEPSVRVSKS